MQLRKLSERRQYIRQFMNNRSNAKEEDTTMVVGYIGFLERWKSRTTAEAVANLISKGYDVRFFVLTGESGQQDLREYCLNLGISDKAVITGPVPHNQVAPFYNLIDIFVVSRLILELLV